MNTKFNTRPLILPAELLLVAVHALPAQMTPTQRLTEAYTLEREGKPAPAITELQELLDSKSLDAAGSGKAWNVLGLACEDQGDLSHAQHAYEESLHILESLPDSTRDYAMALDDFGGIYVTTGQFDVANQLRTKALGLYEKLNDHAGEARASSHLAGTAFSQKNVRDGSKHLRRATREAKLASDLDDEDRAAIASLNGWQAQLEGDAAASVASYRQSLDLLKRRHGEEHPSVGWAYLLLGETDAAAGQLDPALQEMRQGLAILGRTVSDQNPHYLVAELAYSRVLDDAGFHAEAAKLKAVAKPQLNDAYRAQCAGCTVSAAALR